MQTKRKDDARQEDLVGAFFLRTTGRARRRFVRSPGTTGATAERLSQRDLYEY